MRLVQLIKEVDAASAALKKRTDLQIQCARAIERVMYLKGLNQTQFAELMGRHRPEITKWVSGKHNFTINTLAEIERKTGHKILYIK